MKAVIVEQSTTGRRLILAERPFPKVHSGEITIAVKAVSLNNGEVRHALQAADDGYRPGWDVAGVIVHAPIGTGFNVGDRVAGLCFSGAWAERVALPAERVGHIPAGLSFEAAATLPVAGLTATLCLAKRPIGVGDRILITAASGGVGRYALQLTHRSGAHVTASVRNTSLETTMRSLGADEVVVGLDQAARTGPFNMIFDGAGGALLGRALGWLRPRGMVVQFGDAGGDEDTTFDARWFRLRDGDMFGGTTLYGFFLFEELTRPVGAASGGQLLSELGFLLDQHALEPGIGRTARWDDIDSVCRSLLALSSKAKPCSVSRLNSMRLVLGWIAHDG